MRASLAVLLMAPAALGREIFVDNLAGDDRASGEQARAAADRTGPVRTIARALRLAQQGDSVVLAKNDAPYRESVSLAGRRHSGTTDQPFVVRGNGAVLDTSTPVPPEAWEHYEGAIFRFQPRLTTYQQLFLDGRPAAPKPLEADRRLPKLEPRQWCMLDGWMYFCVDKDRLPNDYRPSCARDAAGITLFHVDHLILVDLTVRGFQLDGINLANSARNVRLVGVTCCNNGRNGVMVGGASSVEIYNSTLRGNRLAQLLTLPYSETHLLDTRLSSRTAPAWIDKGGRVFLDGKQVQGGLDEPPSAASQERKP